MNKYFLVVLVWITIASAVYYSTCEFEINTSTSFETQTPLNPSWNVNEVDVNVVWYDTKEELNRIYRRNCIPTHTPCKESVEAFTKTWRGLPCTIHALKPQYVNDTLMDILGHEFSHCLFGTFHPS